MKKRILTLTLFLAALGAGGGIARALINAQTAFVSETALAYNKTFPLDLNAAGMDQLSVQAAYSSATVNSQSFTDGSLSSGQITVASVASLTAVASTDTLTVAAMTGILPAPATGQITVLSTSSLTNATVVVNGLALRNGYEWTSVNTTTGTAEALRALITTFPGLVASRSGSVIYATATVSGAQGNAFTFSSNNSSITVSGANFSGGHNNLLLNAAVTLNGTVLLAGRDWQIAATSSETATNLAAVMNRIGGVQAAAPGSGTVVYATATTAGVAGNSFTLVSNNANLTVGGATFSNGRDAAKVTINGTVLTAVVDFSTQATAALQAKAISNAIVANSAFTGVLTSTWAANGVVYATSSVVGASVNYTLTASGGLTASGATFTGGTATAVNTTNETITIANHAFTTGLPVLLTKSAGTLPVPLAAGTTYYAIPVNSSTFGLALTSTGAVAGLAVNLTSQTNGGTFNLAPLAITGTPSFKWQVSNDNLNWADLTATANNVTISSVTFASPYTATSSYWDFGTINAHYLRLNVVAPTTGGLNLAVSVNGKGLNK